MRTTEVLLMELSFPNTRDDKYLEKGGRRDHSCTSESEERRKPNKSNEPLKRPGGSEVCTVCPGAPSVCPRPVTLRMGRFFLVTSRHVSHRHSMTIGATKTGSTTCATATINLSCNYFPLWPTVGNNRHIGKVPSAFAVNTEGLTLITMTH